MTTITSANTLVVVSNMYPSSRDPAYGVFVRRFVDQMASHYSVVTMVMYKTRNPVKRALLYAMTNVRLCYSLIRNRQAVHYIHFPLYFAPGLLVSPFVSTRVVLNFHGTDNVIDRPLKRLLCTLLKCSISSMQIVAPSATLLSQVSTRYGLPPERLYVSASAGVDSRRYYPVRKVNTASGAPVHRVGFVGNLLDIKGWDVFVDTAIALDQRQRCGPMQFVLAGSGHDELALQKSLMGTKLQFQRYGSLGEAELAELYNSLDVLIFPSRRESLGLVALECLACGTPVVAHAISGPMEYMESGVNGDLCPVGDIECLAMAVERILNLEEGLRQRMRLACVRTARNYEADTVAEQMHAILHSMFSCCESVQKSTQSNGSSAP